MNLYRKQNLIGYIIGVTPARDSDTVVNLLTDKGSSTKIFIAKARAGKSRRAQAIEYFNLVKVRVAEGEGGLNFLEEIKLLKNPRQNCNSLTGLLSFQVAAELMAFYSAEDFEQPVMFQLAEWFAENIDDSTHLQILTNLTLQLLAIHGHLPDLASDIHDGSELTSGELTLIPGEIGYMRGGEYSTKIADRIYKIQRFILDQDLNAIFHLKASNAELIELLDIHIQWIQVSLDRELKAIKLYKQNIAKII